MWVTIQEANMMAETELELWRGFQNVLVTLPQNLYALMTL